MWRVFIPLLQVLAIFMITTDRRLLKRLRGQKATAPETATALEVSNYVARWRLQRLIDGGAVREGQTGLYYLDADGYAVYRRRRRIRAVVIFSAVTAVALVFWWLSR